MLELVVFVCGAVVMILEMVGSRILAPYLGTSIVVWTSLIGVILGCLSLGYWWGGKIADRNATFKTLSLIILLAAVSIASVALSKSMILDLLQSTSESVHLGSTLATLVLFAPPSVLLGMVAPYSVKLKMTDLDKTGRTVGSLYALSTLGSIFGTFLAGFFLIAFFGSTRILTFLALLLVVTSFLAYRRLYPIQGAVGVLVFIVFLAVRSYDDHLARNGFHDIDTDYNRVLITSGVDGETGRELRIMVTNPKAVQSAMYLDDTVELALDYTKFYKLAMHFRPGATRMLMLGGGGYSFPKHVLSHHPNVHMDVVELDPGVTNLARRFFALGDDPRLAIHHEDARTFLNRDHAEFDVVLADTFNSHYSIPFHLTTLEVVRRLHGILSHDGVVMMNLLSSIEGREGRFLQALHATFREVFPQVYLLPVANPADGMTWQNIMLVAFKSETVPSFRSADEELDRYLSHVWSKPVPRDVPILTDDHAPTDRYVLGWP